MKSMLIKSYQNTLVQDRSSSRPPPANSCNKKVFLEKLFCYSCCLELLCPKGHYKMHYETVESALADDSF
jgi:hypothetical protein